MPELFSDDSKRTLDRLRSELVRSTSSVEMLEICEDIDRLIEADLISYQIHLLRRWSAIGFSCSQRYTQTAIEADTLIRKLEARRLDLWRAII